MLKTTTAWSGRSNYVSNRFQHKYIKSRYQYRSEKWRELTARFVIVRTFYRNIPFSPRSYWYFANLKSIFRGDSFLRSFMKSLCRGNVFYILGPSSKQTPTSYHITSISIYMQREYEIKSTDASISYLRLNQFADSQRCNSHFVTHFQPRDFSPEILVPASAIYFSRFDNQK